MIGGLWLSIPRQEIVETVCFVTIGHALEHVVGRKN
jgi:hypothetical protein